MYGFGTYGSGGFGSLLIATETPSAPSISLSIRASSNSVNRFSANQQNNLVAKANVISVTKFNVCKQHNLVAKSKASSSALLGLIKACKLQARTTSNVEVVFNLRSIIEGDYPKLRLRERLNITFQGYSPD